MVVTSLKFHRFRCYGYIIKPNYGRNMLAKNILKNFLAGKKHPPLPCPEAAAASIIKIILREA